MFMSKNASILWSDFNLNLSQPELGQRFFKQLFKLETVPSKGRLSELVSGKNWGKSYKILELLARTTRDLESGTLYDFKNYPFLKNGRKIWNKYIEDFPHEEERLSNVASNLCTKDYNIKIGEENNIDFFDLTSTLKEINKTVHNTDDTSYDLRYQLSVLSILATTWPYWEALRTKNYRGKDKIKVKNFIQSIINMIFPSSNNIITENQDLNNTDYDMPVKDEYERAVFLFENKGDYVASAELFSKIVTNYLTAPNEILGNSYTYLSKCYGISSVRMSPIGTQKELERWAKHYGSTDILLKEHFIHQVPKSFSSADTGLCIFNRLDNSETTKQIFYWVTGTIPSGWNWEILNDSILLKAKQSNSKVRFVFINNSYSQNLEDTLFILEAIRNWQMSGSVNSYMCQNIEIFVRCQEETATALLDTACSFLDSEYPPVRIYLIDEKKRTADYLFAKHPLFYPSTFSFNKCKKDNLGTTLILVSDNPDTEYISWLIRDAFWMLPRTSSNIHSKIIILSPKAVEIATNLASTCPGLSPFTSIIDPVSDAKAPLATTVNINIDDIAFPELEYHPVSINSRAFQYKLETIISNDILPYFVVDSKSDLSAITLGKEIRETIIRKAIEKRQLGNYSSDSIVISVRIQNPDYANLAENLIVPKENEHDGFWFNDYKLITFGSFKDIFSWDQLTGGAIEFISQCIHFQYRNSNDDYDFTRKPTVKDLNSYFHRLYNRSSSFAAAMSIPYRLFEANIVPDRWYISNENSYWGENDRTLLAQKFEEKIKEDTEKETPELINQLARYEHTRWCCYMLSMGWLPATETQTISYINHGVKRHSLQIAKLHPCICSWDDLKNLYRNLHWCYNGTIDDYGKPKINKLFETYSDETLEYFQKIDINNIIQTADILRAKPLPEKQPVLDTEIID